MAGKVFLTGAGPGDPKLMTRKAKEVLGRADVTFHDALIGKEILQALPEICSGELIDCGKRKGEHSLSQREINDRLLERARSGDFVVRLKGGDPFVFGRGGEELVFLRSRGVETEVIPGVTSAVAAPAAAGIPLTHRKVSSQVTFVTGHEDPEKDDSSVQWDRLANLNGTLVVLMGMTNLKRITETLMKNGKEPTTPAATVENATLPNQRVVRGKLEDIADRVSHFGLEPPGTTIIGGVVDLNSQG